MSIVTIYKNKKGFSTLELLLSLAIIGIIVSVIATMLSYTHARSRDARRLDDIKEIQNALELFSADRSGLYPYEPTLSTLIEGNYIQSVPRDPLNTGIHTYVYIPLTASGEQCQTSQCYRYIFRTILEDKTNPVLIGDIDGTVQGLNCDDPAFCIQP